jgi:hypothetical protein
VLHSLHWKVCSIHQKQLIKIRLLVIICTDSNCVYSIFTLNGSGRIVGKQFWVQNWLLKYTSCTEWVIAIKSANDNFKRYVRIHNMPCHSTIMAWVTRFCAADSMKDMKPAWALCTASVSENTKRHVQLGQLQVSCTRAQVQPWPIKSNSMTPKSSTIFYMDQGSNWDWATSQQCEEGWWSDLKLSFIPWHSWQGLPKTFKVPAAVSWPTCMFSPFHLVPCFLPATLTLHPRVSWCCLGAHLIVMAQCGHLHFTSPLYLVFIYPKPRCPREHIVIMKLGHSSLPHLIHLIFNQLLPF